MKHVELLRQHLQPVNKAYLGTLVQIFHDRRVQQAFFKWILSNWAERKYVCGTMKHLSVQKETGKKKRQGMICHKGGNLHLSICQNVLIAL